jgi:hypothetical protein
MATAAMKPATTVEAASAVRPAPAVKPRAAVEAATMESFAAGSTAVETISTEAAIEASMETTIKAAMKAAVEETITVSEAKAKPRAGADEGAALEPIRAVIAVGSAGIWVVIVVAIGASGRRAVIDGRSKSNAEGDALSVRVRSREQANA